MLCVVCDDFMGGAKGDQLEREIILEQVWKDGVPNDRKSHWWE